MYQSKSPNYGAISGAAMKAASDERAMAMRASGKVAAQGLTSVANTQSEMLGAQAKVQAAQAGAEATKMEGLMGGLSSLAGAFGSMGLAGTKQNPAQYTNKVDFGGGKTMMANDNGRLLHSNFDFRIPGR